MTEDKNKPVVDIKPENKFLVIKREYLEGEMVPAGLKASLQMVLLVADCERREKYAEEQNVDYPQARVPNNEYWVVNKDEPYAKQVEDLIFGNTRTNEPLKAELEKFRQSNIDIGNKYLELQREVERLKGDLTKIKKLVPQRLEASLILDRIWEIVDPQTRADKETNNYGRG